MGDKENKKDPIFQGKQSFEEKERKHENKKGLNGKKRWTLSLRCEVGKKIWKGDDLIKWKRGGAGFGNYGRDETATVHFFWGSDLSFWTKLCFFFFLLERYKSG